MVCVQIYGDDDDDDDQLIYRCRCPTCRTLGRFQPNEEFDAAVAALPVGCPYSDDALGTVCSWTGPLQQFSTHPHVFNERPQESESTTESQDSRRRKRDDVADDDVQGPPLKVCRFGRYDVQSSGRQQWHTFPRRHKHYRQSSEQSCSGSRYNCGHSEVDGTSTIVADDCSVGLQNDVQSIIPTRRLNALECRGNYNATSNNMKLVHWPLMGGLLHLVQRRGNWAGPQSAQVPSRLPNVTPIIVLLYNGPFLCGFNVPIKGLNASIVLAMAYITVVLQRILALASIIAGASRVVNISTVEYRF